MEGYLTSYTLRMKVSMEGAWTVLTRLEKIQATKAISFRISMTMTYFHCQSGQPENCFKGKIWGQSETELSRVYRYDLELICVRTNVTSKKTRFQQYTVQDWRVQVPRDIKTAWTYLKFKFSKVLNKLKFIVIQLWNWTYSKLKYSEVLDKFKFTLIQLWDWTHPKSENLYAG